MDPSFEILDFKILLDTDGAEIGYLETGDQLNPVAVHLIKYEKMILKQIDQLLRYLRRQPNYIIDEFVMQTILVSRCTILDDDGLDRTVPKYSAPCFSINSELEYETKGFRIESDRPRWHRDSPECRLMLNSLIDLIKELADDDTLWLCEMDEEDRVTMVITNDPLRKSKESYQSCTLNQEFVRAIQMAPKRKRVYLAWALLNIPGGFVIDNQICQTLIRPLTIKHHKCSLEEFDEICKKVHRDNLEAKKILNHQNEPKIQSLLGKTAVCIMGRAKNFCRKLLGKPAVPKYPEFPKIFKFGANESIKESPLYKKVNTPKKKKSKKRKRVKWNQNQTKLFPVYEHLVRIPEESEIIDAEAQELQNTFDRMINDPETGKKSIFYDIPAAAQQELIHVEAQIKRMMPLLKDMRLNTHQIALDPNKAKSCFIELSKIMNDLNESISRAENHTETHIGDLLEMIQKKDAMEKKSKEEQGKVDDSPSEMSDVSENDYEEK